MASPSRRWGGGLFLRRRSEALFTIVFWSDRMRCSRSNWPGLCLLLRVYRVDFGLFFLFHKFPILLPPPPQAREVYLQLVDLMKQQKVRVVSSGNDYDTIR